MMRAVRHRIALPALLLAAIGCSADPPRIPPSELTEFAPKAQLDTRWSTTLDEAGTGRFEPLVTATSVYAADAEGRVERLALVDGQRVWRVELDTALLSGVGGDDDAVYVAAGDGRVVALDATDGSERWRARASSDVLVPVVSGFGALLVRSADGRLAALDPADGSERWSGSWTPPPLTLHGYSRPLLLDGGVLIGLDDGRLLALDSSNGRPLWETELTRPSGRSEVERLVDIDADVLVDNDGIYVVSFQGRAARVEPARGQVVWGVPMSSTSGLALGDDTLYVVDDESVVHALDKATGTTLWRQEAFRGRKLSAPLHVNDRLLVGDLEGYLHALDTVDGSIAARRRPAKSAIRVRPAGDAQHLVVQSVGGRVAVLRLADGT